MIRMIKRIHHRIQLKKQANKISKEIIKQFMNVLPLMAQKLASVETYEKYIKEMDHDCY